MSLQLMFKHKIQCFINILSTSLKKYYSVTDFMSEFNIQYLQEDMNVPLLFYPILNNVRNTIHPNGLCFRLLSGYSQRSYSNKPFQPFTVIKQEDGSEKKKRKTVIPRITLISQDESMSITTLEEAEKLSKRRELKLIKLVDFDTKTQRPVYKLMTGGEYLQEDLKQRELRKTERDTSNAIKGDKVLIISCNISEHDLKTQLNKITKWISKHYEVKVVVNGNATNMEKAESVYNLLEKEIPSIGRIVQKRKKGNDIKFQILPPKKLKEKEKVS